MAYNLRNAPEKFLFEVYEVLKKYDLKPDDYQDAVVAELRHRGLIEGPVVPAPGPWVVLTNFKDALTWIEDQNGVSVCDFYHRIKDPVSADKQFYHKPGAQENAMLVVHRVNIHDELVAALRVAHGWFADHGERADIQISGQLAQVEVVLEKEDQSNDH